MNWRMVKADSRGSKPSREYGTETMGTPSRCFAIGGSKGGHWRSPRVSLGDGTDPIQLTLSRQVLLVILIIVPEEREELGFFCLFVSFFSCPKHGTQDPVYVRQELYYRATIQENGAKCQNDTFPPTSWSSSQGHGVGVFYKETGGKMMGESMFSFTESPQ